jgi:hypothetical protein
MSQEMSGEEQRRRAPPRKSSRPNADRVSTSTAAVRAPFARTALQNTPGSNERESDRRLTRWSPRSVACETIQAEYQYTA